MSGSLTMQGGMTLDLAGSSFGDGDYALRVDGNALILELLEALQEPAVIDREACDTLVQAVALNTSVSAFAGMEYYANNSDELADGTKSGSVQNLRGEIGVGVRHTMGSTAVYAELSYLNDMLRHNPTATVDGLRGQGANPGRHGIGISAGLQQNLGDGWSVNLNYSMEAMQHADEHRANIGIGKRF